MNDFHAFYRQNLKKKPAYLVTLKNIETFFANKTFVWVGVRNYSQFYLDQQAKY